MIKQEQEQQQITPTYGKCLLNYSKNQLKNVLPILRLIARTCNTSYRFPVLKMLKTIAKLFSINQIQAIFLVHLIKQTGWNISDKLITQNSADVRDVVCYLNDHPQFKNLMLYMLLVCFSLKYFLNENCQNFMESAIRICPSFQFVFQNWIKKHSNLNKRINPKIINRLQVELNISSKYSEPNYNILVDQIIQISPAYNSEKTQKEKRNQEKIQLLKIEEKKLLKLNQVTIESPLLKKIKIENQVSTETNLIFSSSRLYEMAQVGQIKTDVSRFNVFEPNYYHDSSVNFQKNAFDSCNLFGVSHYPIKAEDDYCEELNLGLQQGQSEQQIFMRQDASMVPPSNIINMSVGGFNPERYLNFIGEKCFQPPF